LETETFLISVLYFMALVPYTGGGDISDRLADAIVSTVNGAAAGPYRFLKSLYDSSRAHARQYEPGYFRSSEHYDNVDRNRRMIGLGPVNRTGTMPVSAARPSLSAAYYGGSSFGRRRRLFRRSYVRGFRRYRGRRRLASFRLMRRRGLTAGAYYPKFV